MGEVVVGDETVTGEAVVLAQRLEQLAEPRGVCIQATAQRNLSTTLRHSPLQFTVQDLLSLDWVG